MSHISRTGRGLAAERELFLRGLRTDQPVRAELPLFEPADAIPLAAAAGSGICAGESPPVYGALSFPAKGSNRTKK